MLQTYLVRDKLTRRSKIKKNRDHGNDFQDDRFHGLFKKDGRTPQNAEFPRRRADDFLIWRLRRVREPGLPLFFHR